MRRPAAPPAPLRRPARRRVLLALAGVLALLTAVQGLALERDAARDREAGDTARTEPQQLVSTEVVAHDADADFDAAPPVAPPSLPDAAPVQVDAPAAQAQVDPQPRPQPDPQASDDPQPGAPPEVERLDLSPVTAQQPRLLLEVPEPTAASSSAEQPDPVQQALEIEGVTFATAVDVAELPITSEKGIAPVRIAAVDPNGFRVLTPQVTADADGVWQRIAEGDAAFTHDVGTRLELELGSRVPAGDGEGATLRIGAYASNGVPPIADAVVSRSTARELGLEGTRTVLVSIAEDADPEAIAAALADVTGIEPEVIAQPETRRAFLTGAAARDAFQPFRYVSIGDGMIQIERDWVQRNIVSADVPIFGGKVTCHRLFIPQLRGALQEVEDAGLADHIDPSQYGGCWVPRHILFNPRRPLSMHAWGLAIDFNVKGNEYGNRNPTMHPEIVEIFERWGFVWGGRWSTPDGMHFELGALLQGEEGG